MKFNNLISRLNPNKWGHADERPPRAVLAVTLAAMFLLFTTWAISSPVGSSNDETFHLASMWCSGQGDSDCQVPKFIAAAPCFSEKPCWTPSCRWASDEKLVSTTRFTPLNGEIRLVYYRFGGLIFDDHLESSVIRLRIINSFIATLMFGAAMFLGWGRFSRAFLIAFCAISVPLGLFLIPSVNPQSWLYIGSFSSWVLIWLALTEKNKQRRIWVFIFSLFAVSLAVTSRADGPLILSVITISVSVLAWKEKELNQRKLIPTIIGGLILLFWRDSQIVGGPKNSQIVGALKNSLVEKGSGFFSPYYTMHNLPRMIEFYFGDFATRIGDSDTGMPPLVVLGALFIFVVWLMWALRSVGRPRGFVAFGLLLILIFVPVLVLNNAAYQIGGLFLPRYMWPFLFGFVFVLGSNNRDKLNRLSLGEAALVICAFIPSVTAAQFVLIKRYTVSADSTSWDLNADKLWWWSSGPSPLMTVALGAFFAVILISSLISLVIISEGQGQSEVA